MKMGAHVLKDGLAQELLEKGSPIPGIVFLRTGDGIIELNSIHASKGNALCTLCKKLGISMENVLAIGDNENDISMLQAAGISAAMENAEDDVNRLQNLWPGIMKRMGQRTSWRNARAARQLVSRCCRGTRRCAGSWGARRAARGCPPPPRSRPP